MNLLFSSLRKALVSLSLECKSKYFISIIQDVLIFQEPIETKQKIEINQLIHDQIQLYLILFVSIKDRMSNKSATTAYKKIGTSYKDYYTLLADGKKPCRNMLNPCWMSFYYRVNLITTIVTVIWTFSRSKFHFV